MDLNKITTPTLILDEQKCKSNIQKMAAKAAEFDIRFKPHFKTHQSATIATWFQQEGVNAITVSSLKMASYFSDHGWNDITIAFPVNIRAITKINELAHNAQLSILADDFDVLMHLNKNLTAPVQVYIEIDTGANRTGMSVHNITAIERLSDFIGNANQLVFAGFYSHPGHSYSRSTVKEIQEVHQSALEQFEELAANFSVPRKEYSICVGDTPCCSAGQSFDNIDEISPGNFVFYDLMQTSIGSCNFNDIAIAMACPVVATFPDRREVVVHGGAVHFSKDYIETNGAKNYGIPVPLNDDGWGDPVKNSFLTSLSQEHGVINCSENFLNSVSVGDLIGILPVHSCLTANLMGSFHCLNGEVIPQMK